MNKYLIICMVDIPLLILIW